MLSKYEVTIKCLFHSIWDLLWYILSDLQKGKPAPFNWCWFKSVSYREPFYSLLTICLPRSSPGICNSLWTHGPFWLPQRSISTQEYVHLVQAPDQSTHTPQQIPLRNSMLPFLGKSAGIFHTVTQKEHFLGGGNGKNMQISLQDKMGEKSKTWQLDTNLSN